MNKSLFVNGFLVKSLEEVYEPEIFKFKENYRGIGRYITWPLSDYSDDISKRLEDEAFITWFSYNDERLCAVPDFNFIERYMHHCKELGLDVFCLQIESPISILTTKDRPLLKTVLGFDYCDASLEESCMYEDIYMTDPFCEKRFQCIRDMLNENGLLNNLEEVNQYVEIREELIDKGYDMEDYYFLTPVRFSLVEIQ